jgi:ribosome-associated translation inhibitor RaiA
MLDKRLSLSGFELEPIEKEKVNEVLEKYLVKIEERIKDYQEIKIRMRKSMHGKAFLHEVEGDFIITGKRISSKCTDYNLYKALAEVLEKMLVEIEKLKERTDGKNEKKI